MATLASNGQTSAPATDASMTTTSTNFYRDAPNRFVTAGNIRFAYRELGPHGGTPLVLLNHWGAVLDNFDPGLSTDSHPRIISLYSTIGDRPFRRNGPRDYR